MQLSTQSLCSAQIPNPLINFCSSSLSSLIIYSKSCSTHPYFPSLALKSIPTKQLQCNVIRPRKQRKPGAIFASEAETTAAAAAATTNDAAERWLLQPVGDGDSRHIGFKVSMPAAFEIASSVVTVGRLPEKADIVIPVATVSGTHARIEKKDGVLLVTDLDSTNGTFIGEKRLTPGVTVPISSGSYITFGDTNLAIFRVSKLENIEVSSKSEEQSEAKAETEEPK